jgi:hypothetical protein
VNLRWLVLLILLSSCAPARVTAPRLNVSVPLEQPSYYPLEAGFVWHYLEPGERLDAPMIVRENLGATALKDQEYFLVRVYGRQSLTVYYFQETRQGIFLVREDHEEMVLSYEPPRQLYPSRLEVGEMWHGSSTVRLIEEDHEVGSLTLSYRASVVRQQTVTVAGQTYRAFVVAFEEQYGDRLISTEVWLVPFVGEVRSKEGHFLVKRNFR